MDEAWIEILLKLTIAFALIWFILIPILEWGFEAVNTLAPMPVWLYIFIVLFYGIPFLNKGGFLDAISKALD